MSRKLSYLLLALACVAAMTSGPAQAHDRGRGTIAFSVENFVLGSGSCGATDFPISFDMRSLSGAPLGTGTSCIHTIDDGCFPFRPFCRQTVEATFTLDFGRGTLTAPMTLREILPTETSFIHRGKGKIATGTGDFAGARGRVRGGGAATFTDQGLVGTLVYAVVLTGDTDEDD
jgi:hypothetical protein